MSFFPIFREGSPEFDEALIRLERRGETDLGRVENAVRDVLAAVKAEGDVAVRRYVEKFESRRVERLLEWITGKCGAQPFPETSETALEATRRIRRYHERQLESRELRVRRRRCSPKPRAPARESAFTSPEARRSTPRACHVRDPARWRSRVHRCRDAGGRAGSARPVTSQACAILDAEGRAIAALAYGTQWWRVDKIVGPRNLMAAAKRSFGDVDIDSIADRARSSSLPTTTPIRESSRQICCPRPSTTKPRIRCSPAPALLSRKPSAGSSKADRDPSAARNRGGRGKEPGCALVVSSRDARRDRQPTGRRTSRSTCRSRRARRSHRQSRALFVGDATPEANGGYLAGPSHVLPTGGAARYGAPLSVYDFVSRTSVIRYERSALAAQAEKSNHSRAWKVRGARPSREVRAGDAAVDRSQKRVREGNDETSDRSPPM